MAGYRGRLAPSPTGLLHLGHARTFWIAYQRTRERHGTLLLRNEDLDPQRSRPEYVQAFIEDLHWMGVEWREGPDVGGPFAPYSQSQRYALYEETWRKLRDTSAIYPCACSRKELRQAAGAPHDDDDEPIYPGTCRDRALETCAESPTGANWRFRVPDGEVIAFDDLHYGHVKYVAGRDFGDFAIWRRDGVPAYQLAVTADDHAMGVTEVVRGADLLKSTARQLLLYRALGWKAPEFYHCDLISDETGKRLAKRSDSLSIKAMRERGLKPAEVLALAAI